MVARGWHFGSNPGMKTFHTPRMLSRISILQLPCLIVAASTLIAAAAEQAPAGFTSLFNGRDLTGWKAPEGDNGHWKVVDGAIDYDAGSESKADKNLWSD